MRSKKRDTIDKERTVMESEKLCAGGITLSSNALKYKDKATSRLLLPLPEMLLSIWNRNSYHFQAV